MLSLATDLTKAHATIWPSGDQDGPVNELGKKNSGGSAVLEAESSLTTTLEGMKGALDAMGTNVFVADRDLRLVYMNQRAEETMKKASSTLEELFGISHRELLGSNIDRFHGDRIKQIRRLLGDPSNLPHRKETRGVGGIFFDYLGGDLDATFAFVRDAADQFLEAYLPIAARRTSSPSK